MRRFTYPLTATLAAAFMIGGTALATTAASASTGTTIGTASPKPYAGYEATGRDFRFVSGILGVPNSPSQSSHTTTATDNCTIGAAPSFTVVLTPSRGAGPAPTDLTVTDTSKKNAVLSKGDDYSISAPAPHLIPFGDSYTVTLLNTGSAPTWSYGDSLNFSTSAADWTVSSGGSQTVPAAPTCALSHDPAGNVTVTDTTASPNVTIPASEYSVSGSTLTLANPASTTPAWNYGDSLTVAYSYGTAAVNNSPSEYFQLGSGDSYARAGVKPDGNGGWEAFATVGNSGLTGTYVRYAPIGAVNPGDGVYASIYFNQAGDSLQFRINTPGTATAKGASYSFSADAHGAIYTNAAALTDWSYTSGQSAPSVSVATRVNTVWRGRFTTEAGNRGTFEGPWTLSPVEVTSNGDLPPLGSIIASPSALGTDGGSYNGLPGDTFSVNLAGQ